MKGDSCTAEFQLKLVRKVSKQLIRIATALTNFDEFRPRAFEIAELVGRWTNLIDILEYDLADKKALRTEGSTRKVSGDSYE